MKTIGFIGLGHMGNPMVKNLLTAGYQVVVYDISSEAMEILVEEGAVAAESVAGLAEQADVVMTMLQTGEQVSGVCAGEGGVFSHMSKTAVFIDSSSIAVDACRELHSIADAEGIGMLDAPVSGGVVGAEAGSLTFMVGGDEAILDQVMPLLQTLGKTIIHAGEAGNGQVAKICNNMVLGVSMIAVSEAFVVADGLGLSAEKLFEICRHASGNCWVLEHNVPVSGLVDNVPANRDYEAGFTAQMMLKDLRLSQEAARLSEHPTSLGQAATVLYEKFVDSGNGQLDFSAVIKMLAKASPHAD